MAVHQPEWEKEHVERMQRMVRNIQNHPSVIMWSTGNKADLASIIAR